MSAYAYDVPERDVNPPARSCGICGGDPFACECPEPCEFCGDGPCPNGCEVEGEPEARDFADEPDSRNEWEV